MHTLQSVVTNERVEHLRRMPRWGRNAYGSYYKHTCIINSWICMQGWLHDSKHLHVHSCNFELKQGHAHHTWMI